MLIWIMVMLGMMAMAPSGIYQQHHCRIVGHRAHPPLGQRPTPPIGPAQEQQPRILPGVEGIGHVCSRPPAEVIWQIVVASAGPVMGANLAAVACLWGSERHERILFLARREVTC